MAAPGIPASILPPAVVEWCFGDEKKAVGRAMRTTPNNEIMAAIFSIRLKGSLIKNEQAQHAKLGARKVMTIASASGRYRRESEMNEFDFRPTM